MNELRKLEKPVTRAAPAGAVLLYMQKVLEVFYGDVYKRQILAPASFDEAPHKKTLSSAVP